MYNQLIDLLLQIAPINKQDQKIICERFKPMQLKKGDYFLKENETCKLVGFLCKGIVRYFVYKNDNEATFEFTKENEFVSDYQSFNSQSTSIQNIQAIEDCELLTITYPELQYIYSNTEYGNLMGRIILEHRFDVMVKQIMAIYMQNQEERYRHSVRCYSDLTQRIPQYMIASYIGIQPQSLSRIRKKYR